MLGIPSWAHKHKPNIDPTSPKLDQHRLNVGHPKFVSTGAKHDGIDGVFSAKTWAQDKPNIPNNWCSKPIMDHGFNSPVGPT